MGGLGKSSSGGMGEAETSLDLEALPRRGLLTPVSREESFAALRSSGVGTWVASADWVSGHPPQRGPRSPGGHGLGVR